MFKTASLHGYLEEEVYMRAALGMKEPGKEDGYAICTRLCMA